MTRSVVDLPPIKIFFSYVRADNETLSIATPLKKSLQRLITAFSGRPAEIFLDIDDIKLGEDWHDKIVAAVQQSYFFIPIYTGSYPQSDACRDEFLLFRETAAQRDAARLVIPIVWFGMESLRTEGEDEISDYVRTHQAASFEEAWILGTDSPPYRENVVKIAKRILDVAPEIDMALARAEELEAGPLTVATNTAPNNQESPTEVTALDLDEIEDEQSGILELSEEFNAEVDILTKSASALGDALSDLSDLPEPPPNSQNSAKIASKYMIRAASIMKDPAIVIEQNGQTLFHAAQRSDFLLRRIIRLTEHSESSELLDTLRLSLADGVESLSETQTVATQLDGLLASMKIPEALSASVRRAISPARQGIVAVQDAIRLIGEWPNLVASLAAHP